jgi:hypothetical protein
MSVAVRKRQREQEKVSVPVPQITKKIDDDKEPDRSWDYNDPIVLKTRRRLLFT